MNADSIARALRGSFYRKNRLALAAAALASLLNAVLNLILSWLMQQLIDAAAGAPGGTAIWGAGPGLRRVLSFDFLRRCTFILR